MPPDATPEGPQPAAAAQPAEIAISARELEVLRLVALGHSNREIAEQLAISAETVRNHIRNARDRLGARTKAHAIAIAFQQRLF